MININEWSWCCSFICGFMTGGILGVLLLSVMALGKYADRVMDEEEYNDPRY